MSQSDEDVDAIAAAAAAAIPLPALTSNAERYAPLLDAIGDAHLCVWANARTAQKNSTSTAPRNHLNCSSNRRDFL